MRVLNPAKFSLGGAVDGTVAETRFNRPDGKDGLLGFEYPHLKMRAIYNCAPAHDHVIGIYQTTRIANQVLPML
jgi:hypothetical protein